MTRPGFEPTTSRSLGGHPYRYTTEVRSKQIIEHPFIYVPKEQKVHKTTHQVSLNQLFYPQLSSPSGIPVIEKEVFL